MPGVKIGIYFAEHTGGAREVPRSAVRSRHVRNVEHISPFAPVVHETCWSSIILGSGTSESLGELPPAAFINGSYSQRLNEHKFPSFPPHYNPRDAK